MDFYIWRVWESFSLWNDLNDFCGAVIKSVVFFIMFSLRYETTSSEESSGDEKSKVEVEEEDSSEPEVEKEPEKEPEKQPEEGAEAQRKDAEVPTEGGGAVAQEKETERGLLDPESSQELLEEQAGG